MMQRKPGFPVANCSIKMPDTLPATEPSCEEDGEQQQRRLQLVNFGHSQWGFNNWSWSVTKQELDFVDMTNGKYCAGVVAFVSVTVKNLDIHRENIGYATSVANNKGFAIYKSRKVAVTNALRETLLSFGGTIATELIELLETSKDTANDPTPENNKNLANANLVAANAPAPITNLANATNQSANHVSSPVKPSEGPPLVKNIRKESEAPANVPAPVKNAAPIARAQPMPAHVPPGPGPAPARLCAARGPAPAAMAPPRGGSNEGAKLENMSEEEARAERKRRQRQAQEEFRQKQLGKQGNIDDKGERNSSLDQLLLQIPTQDIVIEDTGTSNKRKSPTPDVCAKRRAGLSKLDIQHD